jgi:hypothetical protein
LSKKSFLQRSNHVLLFFFFSVGFFFFSKTKGHYAPVLVDHILEMNSQLAGTNQPGKVTIPINSLGIGNGLTNPLVQYNSYITYAKSNPVESSWGLATLGYTVLPAHSSQHAHSYENIV